MDEILVKRLAAEPLIQVSDIIVAESDARRLRDFPFAVRRFWRNVVPQAGVRLAEWTRDILLAGFAWTHPGQRGKIEGDYALIAARIGARFLRTKNANLLDRLFETTQQRPQLAVVLGEPKLTRAILQFPDHGTVALQRPDFAQLSGSREEGPRTVSVEVHRTTADGSFGRPIDQEEIPIDECDTLASLRIKSDIVGARLCLCTIRALADGSLPLSPEERPRDCRASGRNPLDGARLCDLHKRLANNARTQMVTLREQPSLIERARLLAQYVLLLPLLLYWRRRFRQQCQVPISILFYHVVANKPVNHMCLPLEEFAQQMQFLLRYFNIVPLNAAVDRLRSGTNEDFAVALTFDDGYKDNHWAIEYLRFYEIPAAFFISIGHIRDGSKFEHDLRLGFDDAPPMSAAEVRELSEQGFLIGSHGFHHEDFGKIRGREAEQALAESRERLDVLIGERPEHFAFPIGQKGVNITAETFELALRCYPYLYSAYGGYNFPAHGLQHFLRLPTQLHVLQLAMAVDGYTGFRQCLAGNVWGLGMKDAPPY